MTDSIENPSPVVLDMQTRAQVCNDVIQGTAYMRQCGKTYLPQWVHEPDEDWTARLASSALYPALGKSLAMLAGKPFSSPISYGQDFPAQLAKFMPNIDRFGNSGDVFWQSVLYTALTDGICWVLSDYTSSESNLTYQQQLEQGLRPFLLKIPLSSMIGWKMDKTSLVPKVTQVRYYEDNYEDSGSFSETLFRDIRVLEPGKSTLYRKGQDSIYTMIKETPIRHPKLKDRIPITPFYTKQTGFWRALPPLEDAAWLNVQHWQSASDQRTILHIARVPFLAADEDLRANTSEKLSFQAKGVLTGLKNLHYVLHNGESIGAGENDLKRLELYIKNIVGELLVAEKEQTATEINQNVVSETSWLKKVMIHFVDSMEIVLDDMAAWLGLDEGGSVNVNLKWDEKELEEGMLNAYGNAFTSRILTRKRILYNLQMKQIIPANVSIDQELKELEEEDSKILSEKQKEVTQQNEIEKKQSVNK